MRPRSRIQTTGPNNGHQLRDYSKRSNKSEIATPHSRRESLDLNQPTARRKLHSNKRSNSKKMKKVMTVLSLIAISIIHVHLNMFTVENPVNPSFWIAFIFECNPFGGGNWRILAELLMMGIQCIVTSIFAIYILKWDNIRKWFLSFIICAVTYIFLRQFLDVLSNHIMIQFYDNIYGYGGASECCIVFSILQIVYILVYVLLRTNIVDQRTVTIF